MQELNLNPLEIRDLITRYSSELKKLNFQINRTKRTIQELEEALKYKGAGSLLQPMVTSVGETAETVVEEVPQATPEPKKKRKRGRPKKKKEEAAEASPKKKRGPGRPPKKKKEEAAEASPKKKRGPGRPPKKKVKKEELPKVVKDNKPKAKRRVRFNETDVFLMDTLEGKGKILIAAELLDEGLKMADSKGEQVTEEDMKTRINRSLQKLANRRDEILKVKFQGRGFAYALPTWIDKTGTLKPQFMR